jgi:nitric oxide reductase NorD protein
MEEHVGALWHKLVTGAAERRHPKEAASLDGIARTAGILFRAFGGDGGLVVKAATATVHGARRRWLQRIAGSGEKVELAWRDGETLRLPATIDWFPERALNRDLYLWLIALAAADKHDRLPWLKRNQRATLEVFERFPGMEPRYRRLVEALLVLRPRPEELPADEAARERAIRQTLAEPGSVPFLPFARRPFQPVPLWLHPEPPAIVAVAGGSGEPQAPEPGGSSRNGDQHRYQAERVEMPDGKNGFMLFFRAESIFSWTEYVKVNRPTEEDEDFGADQAAADLERLSVARDGQTTASRLRFDLDLPSAAADDLPLGGGILLPEWHYRKQVMQPGHCRVQPLIARDAEPCALPSHLATVARRVRSQFAALAPARVWVKGQADGTEPDLDAYVQFAADRAGGMLAQDRGLYRAQQRRERDLACLLLADLSLSTDAYVSDSARVIDVIRDSLFLFSEALTATGDRFGLYGFSSLRRDNVRFHVLKNFGERYGAGARGRIAAIKPGYYTRMGGAIRYASQLLQRQPAARRLLLILTDGKPNDLDQYEGRYGIEDTRMALTEARRLGLRPFCVTVDETANTYLPHLFGVGGYAVIRKTSDLPRQLPLLYAQLTR